MTFFETYAAELAQSVTADPDGYALRPNESTDDYARATAAKMVAAMRAAGDVAAVHYTTPTFRRACKRLGIPHTRAGINARIAADVAA
jgi:hypothetical protein